MANSEVGVGGTSVAVGGVVGEGVGATSSPQAASDTRVTAKMNVAMNNLVNVISPAYSNYRVLSSNEPAMVTCLETRAAAGR